MGRWSSRVYFDNECGTCGRPIREDDEFCSSACERAAEERVAFLESIAYDNDDPPQAHAA